MDVKALYAISYGVFMLAVKADDKVNGCIINTGIQVASNPTRIAISCINANYTCELLKQSGAFTLSVLDNTCLYQTLKHFGMQSGRTVDKFDGLELPTDARGVPYIDWQTCSMLSCRVVEQHDFGSHTLFIAELDDARVLSDNPPLTYADYQNRLKPKPQKHAQEKEILGWRCRICGYVYEGAALPSEFQCPLCGHPADDFEPIYK